MSRYFIPYGNRWYRYCANKSPRQRSAVTFLALGFLIGGWTFGFYWPLQKRIIYYNTHAKTLRKQSHAVTRETKKRSHDNAKIAELRNSITNHPACSCASDRLQDVIFALIGLSADTGVKQVSVSTSGHKDKTWYVRDLIQFSGCGSFAQIIGFFGKVALSGLLIECTNCSLTTRDDKSMAIRADLALIHKVNASLCQSNIKTSPPT